MVPARSFTKDGRRFPISLFVLLPEHSYSVVAEVDDVDCPVFGNRHIGRAFEPRRPIASVAEYAEQCPVRSEYLNSVGSATLVTIESKSAAVKAQEERPEAGTIMPNGCPVCAAA